MRTSYGCAVLSVCLLVMSTQCTTSKEPTMEALNRVVLNRADTVYMFYTINAREIEIKPQDNYYHWYKPDTILITQNDFSGKVLNGSFVVYYPNKNLKEKGGFEFGLKAGQWKSWFPHGQLQAITHWRKGKREGNVEEYNEQGNILRKGQYKNNSFTGYVQQYSNDSVKNKVLYRDGKPREQKDSTAQSATPNVPKQ